MLERVTVMPADGYAVTTIERRVAAVEGSTAGEWIPPPLQRSGSTS